MSNEVQPTASNLAEDDPRPVVRLPAAGPSGSLIAGVAGVLAVLLFVGIERSRGAPAPPAPQAAAGTFAPVPPLVVPPEPVPPAPAAAIQPAAPRTFPRYAMPPVQSAPAVFPVYSAPPVAPPVVVQSSSDRAVRTSEAALVIDGGVEQPATIRSDVASPSITAANATPGSGAVAAAADEAPARAALLGNPTTTMPTGTIIAAVLETPIDTARPGLARAIVDADVRGFDGARVLVARGSRLIGDFQADVRPGQNRVLVTWSRLIRPDGVTIRLASPGADALGGAGVPGRVHSYFLERFASAVLQSALAAGVNLASRSGSGSVVIEGSGQGLNSVVGQQLLPGNDLKPKITIRAGAAVDVFVAHDLDFSGVPALRRRSSP